MEDEKIISEFNEAAFQISRLHNIWLESKGLRERGKLEQYKWKLDSATIELWTDALRLDRDQPKEVEEGKGYVFRLTQVDKIINETKDNAILYQKLMEKEKILRELQEECGKGARFKPADDDFM